MEKRRVVKSKRDRKSRLEILKKLPDQYEPPQNDVSRMNENEYNKLRNLIATVNEGKSYLDHMTIKREFNNPEYTQKIIDSYRIEEIGSNLPGNIYNPYNVVTSSEEYYDGIVKKQNDFFFNKSKK